MFTQVRSECGRGSTLPDQQNQLEALHAQAFAKLKEIKYAKLKEIKSVMT